MIKLTVILRTAKRPSFLWKSVKDDIIQSDDGYILFDGTIAEKDFSHKIQGVRSQYSGNDHGVIKGIRVVNCVYVNPDINKFWALDYRIFDPEIDGKDKLVHAIEMLNNVIKHKFIKFKTVLMDSWYAVKLLMLKIN